MISDLKFCIGVALTSFPLWFVVCSWRLCYGYKSKAEYGATVFKASVLLTTITLMLAYGIRLLISNH